MRERPWDDLGGRPAGSTPPRGRRTTPAGRRPVVSYHPGASRRASRRLTRRADRAVTVAGGVHGLRSGGGERPGRVEHGPRRGCLIGTRPEHADLGDRPCLRAPLGRRLRRHGGAPNLAPARGVRRSWRRRQPPGGRDDPVPTVSPHGRADGDRSCGRPRHNRRRLPGAGAARPPGPPEASCARCQTCGPEGHPGRRPRVRPTPRRRVKRIPRRLIRPRARGPLRRRRSGPLPVGPFPRHHAARRRRPLPVQRRRPSRGQRGAQLPGRHRCPRPSAERRRSDAAVGRNQQPQTPHRPAHAGKDPEPDPAPEPTDGCAA